MLTDTARRQTDAVRFVLRGVAWSLGFFGLLRLTWIEAHVVLPFTRVQAAVAAGCSARRRCPSRPRLRAAGPTRWRCASGPSSPTRCGGATRLAGAGGGVALILGLNTLRIGTLGRAAASPAWFNALHLYVWPAVLTLAIAGYVFAWMRLADRRPTPDEEAVAHRSDAREDVAILARRGPQPSRRFVVLTVAFLLLFSAASPLYLGSPSLFALAGFVARAAAAMLGGVGVSAHAAANVLWTPRGGFLVTQECISTPLIPVYLAAVCTYSTTWRRLILGVLATLPLFIALGIVRLLVVALPDVVASPLFFVHAFYQLLLGAVVVFLAALWRHGGRAAHRPRTARRHRGRGVRPAARARSTRAWSHIQPARRSTIRRERSRSSPRSRSASISRYGLRRSPPSAGGGSSPGSRCSGSRRRQACSRCTPSSATPA